MPADIKEFGVDESGAEHGSDEDILNDVPDPTKEDKVSEVPVVEDDEEESDDESDEEESDDDEEESDDEDDEAEEDEEDDAADEDAEEDDEESFSERPSLKTITKKFPEFKKILKEFPGLRQAYFNERSYREVFATPDDAKVAHEHSEVLTNLRGQLLGGEIGPLLQAVHEEKPEAVAELVDNFLPTLQKNAKGLYLRAITPIVYELIHRMHQEGLDNEKVNPKDVNMKHSALFLAKFVTGKTELPTMPKREENQEADPKTKKDLESLSQLRQEIAQNFRDAVVTDCEETIKTKIAKQIAKLDPEGKLKPLEKRALSTDMRKELSKLLRSDRVHQSNMDRAWNEAVSKGFKTEHKASNVSAFLARAVQLLPLARRKVQSEVLNEKSAKDGKKKNKNRVPQSKGGVPRQKPNGKVPRGMTDEDFLNKD